ncbi:5-oxoprolinase subunit C family protein [Inhella gelatinilytica]|uniref:Biotin-dependent carboxyltransferase family protein n=1 Tax=Inhella gelatinilytica TaxID=2795030 RepID=A0A931NCI8_9BURK|nr:biotin-dependent carboxyltransferase family protein [Inhella gelatinilytica]MBH9551315.1 biotin-dependent carboxyltransferase family protein [Inhella gelatinilytica]
MLEVVRAAALCSVQDLGRPGRQHLGVPRGGALDRTALQRANLLVGNPAEAAALEVLAGPLRLRFHRAGWLALCGAAFEMHLNGRPLRTEWRWPFPAGAELVLRGPVTGRVGILALDGGLAVDPVLGSRATQIPGGFGGWQGRTLQAGDRLPLGPPRSLLGVRGLRVPAVEPGLRVVPGPEWAALTAASQRQWTEQLWRMSPQSDRMGVWLEGAPLRFSTSVEMRSHAVAAGWIQLPPAGQPIVLLPGCQSTGGYPRIAAVIEADLGALAQWRPGEARRFRWVTPDEARAARQVQGVQYAQWEWACAGSI